jgi:hypothetical protein
MRQERLKGVLGGLDATKRRECVCGGGLDATNVVTGWEITFVVRVSLCGWKRAFALRGASLLVLNPHVTIRIAETVSSSIVPS